ncbi:MAG: STAS/SEC14 domain-containing protein [Bacteroidales bacterium]
MGYSIKIDHQFNIIRYKHYGTIERSELGEAWNQLINIREFANGQFDLLSDYSGCQFNITVGDLKVIEDFLKSITHITRGKKQAIIVDNPKTTAVSIIIGSKIGQETGFHAEIFSTQDTAINWLNSG